MDKRTTWPPSDLPAAGPAPKAGPLSRRSILRTAIGVTAGAAAATLASVVPAAAATNDPVLAGNITLAEGTTEVLYDGAAGFTGVVLLANDSSWFPSQSSYAAALGGWAGAGGSAGAGGVTNGVYGYSDAGAGHGVIGVAFSNDGLTGGAGVFGRSTSAGIVGVLAQGNGITGAALRVQGVASFNRSGKANVLKNRAYVDIVVPGGLLAASSVLATIQLYRVGVWIAGVRLNYPTAGKVRIYLNKVASTTASTPVAWFVVG